MRGILALLVLALTSQGTTAEDCLPASQLVEARKAAVARSVEAIRRLRLDLRPPELEAWARLDTSAQAQMERTAMDALASIAVRQLRNSLASAKSLTPWNVNKDPLLLQLRRLEERWSVPTGQLQRTIRDIAGLQGKPVTQGLANDAIKGFDDVRKLARDSTRVATGEANAPLKSVATLLGLLVQDQRLSLAVTDINLASAIGYYLTVNQFAGSQLERLEELSVGDFRSLAALSKQLKTDVAALSTARRQSDNCKSQAAMSRVPTLDCYPLQRAMYQDWKACVDACYAAPAPTPGALDRMSARRHARPMRKPGFPLPAKIERDRSSKPGTIPLLKLMDASRIGYANGRG